MYYKKNYLKASLYIEYIAVFKKTSHHVQTAPRSKKHHRRVQCGPPRTNEIRFPRSKNGNGLLLVLQLSCKNK